jgi:hypothetical protein
MSRPNRPDCHADVARKSRWIRAPFEIPRSAALKSMKNQRDGDATPAASTGIARLTATATRITVA